jgi:hypothetical protein
MLFSVRVAISCRLGTRRRLGCHNGRRFSAERVADKSRPCDDDQTGDAQHAGQQLRLRDGQGRQPLSFVLAEGRVQVTDQSAKSPRIIARVYRATFVS